MVQKQLGPQLQAESLEQTLDGVRVHLVHAGSGDGRIPRLVALTLQGRLRSGVRLPDGPRNDELIASIV